MVHRAIDFIISVNAAKAAREPVWVSQQLEERLAKPFRSQSIEIWELTQTHRFEKTH
jgi:hypothetical protein